MKVETYITWIIITIPRQNPLTGQCCVLFGETGKPIQRRNKYMSLSTTEIPNGQSFKLDTSCGCIGRVPILDMPQVRITDYSVDP